MNQLLLLLISLSLNLSLQTQLFRDLSGLTAQNLQAQASDWTLSDPSGTQHPISLAECKTPKTQNLVFKPSSLPSETTLKKTFDDLGEDHNVLRFFFSLYYMGDGYTSQTVTVKFDEISLDTSKLYIYSDREVSCSPLGFKHQINYYGFVKHATSSVTVEFGENLRGNNQINWGIRDFSIVTDLFETPQTRIYAKSDYGYSGLRMRRYPCFNGEYPDLGNMECRPCNSSCEFCYGSGEDHCFTYLTTEPEARLCPEGQTLLSSGCTNCQIENCLSCDKDVSQCDTCLTTCEDCDDSGVTPQCKRCTWESSLFLYQGSCIESCPLGSYEEGRECPLCQPGCLDCTDVGQCTDCHSETTSVDGTCICNEPGKYFEESSQACTGKCPLGCEQCFNGEECNICAPGTTLHPDGDCRCDNDGFYFDDNARSCTAQCEDYCLQCHNISSCFACSGNRIFKGGRCKCESPRILIGDNCECPAYMTENPDTLNCQFIDLVDIAYQSPVSPLFDVTLQLQWNPLMKTTGSASITWTVDCTYENPDTLSMLQDYISTQSIDILRIPSEYLEYSSQCDVTASFSNRNRDQVSKSITFMTLSSSQPQVHIYGGSLQTINRAELNFIFAEVKSSTGEVLSSSDLQRVTWIQTSGDKLNMKKMFSSSDPFQLKIPQCTLSKGKTYTFKISVTTKNSLQEASQEVTIGVHASKIATQMTGLSDNYHLYSQPLTLKAQLSLPNSDDDECKNNLKLSNLIDSSTALYTWECFYLDLDLPTTRILLDAPEITDDPNIQAHPDPLKLFYRGRSSPMLTIPNSYFTLYPNYQFFFDLTVTVQSTDPTPTITKFSLQQPSLYNPKKSINVRIVTSKPSSIPHPSLTCMSENHCQAYSDDFPTKFVSSYPKFNPSYSYDWEVDTIGASNKLTSYSTFLTINSITSRDGSNIAPLILFTINDIASAFFALPWNKPPSGIGFLNVVPWDGEAYKTKFFISTSHWADADLPLSYQFFTTYKTVALGGSPGLPGSPGIPGSPGLPTPEDSEDTSKSLMPRTLSPYTETIVLPEAGNSECGVGVIVYDNLKSTTKTQRTVNLYNTAESLCDAVEKGRQALVESKESPDLDQKFQLARVIMENLRSWEAYEERELYGYDEHRELIDEDELPCHTIDAEFKLATINEMKNIFKTLNFKEELRVPLLNSMTKVSDPFWNQDQNWRLYMSILDSYFQAASSKSVLPPEEYNLFMRIVDNFIYYMKKPANTLEASDKLIIYINTLIRSTLSQKIPTDEAVFYKGVFYSYFTHKATYCQVLEDFFVVPFGDPGLITNVTLLPNKRIPAGKCHHQIDMIFLAFRSSYEYPYGKTYSQDVFYLDLRDSITKTSLLNIFNFTLTPAIDCPKISQDEEEEEIEDEDDEEEEEDEYWEDEEEECTGGGGTEVYGVFDLKDQVNKIFIKSNIDQIQNISVLEDFAFWKSVAFWTVIAFSGWFVVSFYWLYVKHPTYCALKASKNITQKSLFRKSSLFFWLVHPLVGIYLYNDPKATKPTKLAIYYQRLVVVMMFSSIFSSIEQGEGRIFKTYILLFNTLTITPVSALLSRIFETVFSSSTKSSTTSRKILTYIKILSGIILYLACLVGCFLVMFIIEAQSEASQNKDWAFNFLISFVQDLSLSPLISIINKVFLIKLTQSDSFAKVRKYPKILDILIPPTFRSIYEAIFVKIKITIPVVDDCQSPRITTMSPLSSDRKLFKFGTLDLQSPTSSKAQTPFEFRSRRASETDMNTVDILATEALVNNRFQTFFSEAKPETIKDFSPRIKQNYPKMQSSNLYSSSSTSITKLQQSQGGNQKSSLLKPKKVHTSIMFNPETQATEIIHPDEIFSYEESGVIMSASQPKLWKDAKTMESSAHKKKSKTRSRSSSKRCETVT